MDREQDDMQYLGLFGIYKESSKITFKWKKIFSQISLIFILPLSFIFLAHMEISHILLRRIYLTKTYSRLYHRTNDAVNSEWAAFWLFKAAYFTVLLIFGLLSTSAVVYTIACAYTAREIAFKKIMSVVPKIWKRVMVTFLCTFLAFFLYNVVAVLALMLWEFFDQRSEGNNAAGAIIGIIMLILYIIGFIYMCIIWQLANVVSVLEETRGFKAMIKSKKLLKGKMWPATFILFMLLVLAFAIQFSFQIMVVDGWELRIVAVGRVTFGILCLLLLLMLILFGLVLQTVLYFVCKSYHNENIDKSALWDHLEVIYLGDHDPLSKDVQLQQV